MSAGFGFVALGALLGTFLSFPGFVVAAIVCSMLYSWHNFDGTVMGGAANLLVAIAALQFGYFLAFIAAVVSRRFGRRRFSKQ